MQENPSTTSILIVSLALFICMLALGITAGYYAGANAGLLSDYSGKIEKLEKDKQVISQQYINAIDVVKFAVQKDTTGTVLAIAKKKGL